MHTLQSGVQIVVVDLDVSSKLVNAGLTTNRPGQQTLRSYKRHHSKLQKVLTAAGVRLQRTERTKTLQPPLCGRAG